MDFQTRSGAASCIQSYIHEKAQSRKRPASKSWAGISRASRTRAEGLHFDNVFYKKM